MAFLDQMKDKINATSQKAKDMTETARLNGQISEAEKSINELYRKLGFEIYRAYQHKSTLDDTELIAQITELHEKVAALQAQIKALNPSGFCPECGAKISKDMIFCTNCGTKLSVQENPADRCAACGAALEKDALFCTNCGTRVEAKE